MDLESVAAVESIADTVSEFGTEGDTHSLFHDEELIDRDEVIEDPDYAGMPSRLFLLTETPRKNNKRSKQKRSRLRLSRRRSQHRSQRSSTSRQ